MFYRSSKTCKKSHFYFSKRENIVYIIIVLFFKLCAPVAGPHFSQGGGGWCVNLLLLSANEVYEGYVLHVCASHSVNGGGDI